MNRITIAGIGELLWDVLPEAEVLGGAPVNFAYHVTALGARGIPISTIGRDLRGERALRELRLRGVETGGISVCDRFTTGYVEIRLDDEGKASYHFPEEVAWDHLQLNPYASSLRDGFDAVCFGTLAQRSPGSRRVIRDFLDSLKPETLRVFDVNLRQNFFSAPVIEASLHRADILKLNEEELPVVAQLLSLPGPSEKWLPTLIRRFGLQLAILSRGAGGSLLITGEHSSDHPGVAAAVVDTIGAGDSFTAAATIGFLRGETLEEINRQANRVAAYVCSLQGAMPPMSGAMEWVGGGTRD